MKSIYRFFRYRNQRGKIFRELPIRRVQDRLLKEKYSDQVSSLIVFIVPGADWKTGRDKITGGTISIVSLCEETAGLYEFHGAQTIMCTLNEDHLFLKHEMFENSTPVFRFSQLSGYFKNARKLLIHLPEYLAASYLNTLTNNDRNWLSRLDDFHVNIMNQNIRLMPEVETVKRLRAHAGRVTITTAHQKYCTAHYREIYGVPLHKFSVWISPEQYDFRTFDDKSNLIVVSPDPSPLKEKVLKELASVPGLEIKIIKNLTYSEYKKLVATAKWSLTFGEGLDGYFIEPVFSGAVSFAFYNEEFFTEDFKQLDTILKDQVDPAKAIIEMIARLDDREFFAQYQKMEFDLCAKYYSVEAYKENILAFYNQKYTFN